MALRLGLACQNESSDSMDPEASICEHLRYLRFLFFLHAAPSLYQAAFLLDPA